MAEVHEELMQDEDEKITEEKEEAYQEYLANHWVTQLISKRN